MEVEEMKRLGDLELINLFEAMCETGSQVGRTLIIEEMYNRMSGDTENDKFKCPFCGSNNYDVIQIEPTLKVLGQNYNVKGYYICSRCSIMFKSPEKLMSNVK